MFPTPWISNLPEAIPHDRHRQSFSFKRGSPDNPTGNGNAPVAKGDQVGRMSEANEPRSGRKSLRGCVFDCRAMPNPFWDETRARRARLRLLQFVSGITGLQGVQSMILKTRSGDLTT